MTDFASLAAALREEQRACWQRGDMVRVEAYLEKHPELRADADAILDLVWHELVLRRERSEAPQLADYLRRFPHLTPQLHSLFQLLEEDDGAPRTAVVAPPFSPTPEGSSCPPAATGAPMPVVPGYEILGELGRGGMGVVYKARQCSLKRLVALKMILVGPNADPAIRARFRTEAEAVARLQHPNIVQIHEVGEHDGRPFLALEYVDGSILKRKLAGTAQPEREAARLVETLARAVHYTHQRGILHRDLKPANVLLASDGTPKITDFGVAKLLDEDSGTTRTETLIGTPSYMSPEQASGDRDTIGVRADVYSLGAILYELLTGRVPFQGGTLLGTLEQVRTLAPVPPRQLCGGVSRDLETICLKCLEKAPGNRYASAETLADDLRRFLRGEPIQARRVGVALRAWRAVRRRPALVTRGLGLAALAFVTLTAWSHFRVAAELTQRQAEERYRQFVQHRDAAFCHGLLAPEEGALFLGSGADANLRAADAAARQALALAGMGLDSQGPAADAPLPAHRQAEVAADCYALLLVLAGVRGQQHLPGQGDGEQAEEALRLLDRAAQIGFRTRTFHLRRAHFLERAGRPEEARADRERAAALAPEGALDHFLLGEERYRHGDWAAAEDSFNRALGKQPGHFWAQFFLAVCHLKGQRWETARAGLNACLAQQPEFIWGYLFRSFTHERLQAPADAEADFETALRLNPNDDARYVLLLTRGILHFNQGELQRAEADFRSALALKPGQYNAYLNLAHVHLARGQVERAEEEVQRALQLGPPIEVVTGYHVGRGRALLRDKHPGKALAASEAALKLAPDQPAAYEVRACALLGLGRHESAEWSFDEYLRRGGETTADVCRGRGTARMRLGKYAEAAEDYTRALERAPDAQLYQHRGWAHFFADAWKLALRDFARSLELDPEAGDAYTGRALARVMLGQYRDAVADAGAALAHRPGTPEMMHNLACVFAQAAARAAADRTEEDAPALAIDYRRRAVLAVERTLALVPPAERAAFWRDRILPDTALAPVHKEAEFQRFRAEYARPPGQQR